jgi:CelD/BcsL family acetyltransferase involved in cellulose biosynthesis
MMTRVPTQIRNTGLVLKEITTRDGLESLRAEWSGLWQASRFATPYQSPEWLIPWWNHFGDGELWTLAFRDAAGLLLGLIPLTLYFDGVHRKVLLLGSGNSDYLDGIFRPEFEQECVWACLHHLARNKHRWDRCDFLQLQASSPLLSLVAPAFHYDARFCGEPCPAVQLPDIPSHQRSKLRYYRRKLEQLGPLTFDTATPENAEMFLQTTIELHTKRWAARGQTGVLAEHRVQNFLREAVPALAAAGFLEIHLMRVCERVIASYLGFKHRNRAYYYIGGFDTELAALSPGMVMVGHAIHHAAAQGCEVFDFLRGSESYKYRWGATDQPTFRRELRHTGPVYA